jgi:hypothetical protein
MSLWDDVHRVPGPIDDWKGVEAFDVSDILRWFHEAPDDALDWTRVPNAAPPFGRYFMFGYSPLYRAGGDEVHLNAEMGAFFDSAKSPDGSWAVTARICGGRRATWQNVSLSFHVNADGGVDHAARFLLSSDGGFNLAKALAYKASELSQKHGRVVTPEQVASAEVDVIYPFLVATSILHCKNVTARRVHPPEKLAKAAAKRGRPIYSYSVLDLKPMRRILDGEGGMGHGASLAKALHVCRGHFKDYRDGAGLFGRVKGLFWWEQSLRGNVANGVHVKDYRVKTGEVTT